jgi:mannobiose 2-epimerase
MLFQRLQRDLHIELDRILDYWSSNTIDTVYGGFVGRIDENNYPVLGSQKGSVLNARICWTFSSAWQLTRNPEHAMLARRAFEYIDQYFIDPVHGGVYWTLDYSGKPEDQKKQVYAIAFVIYAFAEWYKASGDEKALTRAKELYRVIEKYSRDHQFGGYVEAFSRNWQPIEDLRLSDKDANEAKTMNTHLHILEAYTNLYKVWQDEKLATDIRDLLSVFDKRIINISNGHLHLYFGEKWNVRSESISFGHDIEAGWLLLEACETLEIPGLTEQFRNLSVRLTDAALEGMDTDAGLWYEMENGQLVKEKHWWPQAEALVGLYNAWQITLEEKYLQQLLKVWTFIQVRLTDKKHGDWYWGIEADYSPMKGQDKVGLWKCPYHNGRACIELINRIRKGAFKHVHT